VWRQAGGVYVAPRPENKLHLYAYWQCGLDSSDFQKSRASKRFRVKIQSYLLFQLLQILFKPSTKISKQNTVTMAVPFVIPKEYGYVLVTASASMFFSVWQGMRVGPFRKAAKIPYPNAYASPDQIEACADEKEKQAKYLFNCAQRAHYNFLENYVATLPAILIAGLAYPVTSAASGAIWLVFRYMYAVGYTRADKTNGKGRMAGSGFWLAQAVLFGMVGKMGFDALMMK